MRYLLLSLLLSGCAMPEREVQERTDRCMQFGMDAVLHKSWYRTGFSEIECVPRTRDWDRT
jgi:hypothetical protein